MSVALFVAAYKSTQLLTSLWLKALCALMIIIYNNVVLMLCPCEPIAFIQGQVGLLSQEHVSCRERWVLTAVL